MIGDVTPGTNFLARATADRCHDRAGQTWDAFRMG
jgi:hypothetical protein